MECLKGNGSMAARGFMRPEGIVIYHTAARVFFKKTFDHDAGKGVPSESGIPISSAWRSALFSCGSSASAARAAILA
jgi:hypothetical protein